MSKIHVAVRRQRTLDEKRTDAIIAERQAQLQADAALHPVREMILNFISNSTVAPTVRDIAVGLSLDHDSVRMHCNILHRAKLIA